MGRTLSISIWTRYKENIAALFNHNLMALVRSLLLGSCIVIFTISAYHIATSGLPAFLTRDMADLNSPASGFLQHPLSAHPNSYEPKRTELDLVVLQNSKVEPSGFTLAVFKDKTAIDAQGHIHSLSQAKYNSLINLAAKVADLPKTGGFRNQWRVKHPITGRSIERILSPKSSLSERPAEDYETEFDETSIYGFSKDTKKLEKSINGYEELPEDLWELTRAALESKKAGDPKDEVVLGKVRAILGNVF
ncbi:hypothetical protein CPB83DRAFT_861754 [Crepidotus variabilis]|uniref:Uncharacterized protein n=1 Tax=Crepidotus variabilis TaxID=179855 RepID=A0A9P6E7P5_9AGAR|nr:hypothetical protein CPB83DRAFT_861754 [Crepidotus variabilis]